MVKGDKVDTAISGCLPRKTVGHTQSIATATYLPCSPNLGGVGGAHLILLLPPPHKMSDLDFKTLLGSHLQLVHFVSSNGVPKSQNVRS